MTATLCLIGCLLAPAQAPDRPAPAVRGEWPSHPISARPRNSSTAARSPKRPTAPASSSTAPSASRRAFFVLETPAEGADVAFLTILKSRDPQRGAPAGGEPTAESVRLELAHVDGQGGVKADPGVALTAPLEGPPTLECGAFAVVPDGRVAADATWETAEEGRPVRSLAGDRAPSRIDGERCVKLEGVQKSDDWDKPRGDRARLAPHRHGLAGRRTRRRLPRGARRRTPRAGPPRPDLQGRAALQPGRVDAVHRPAVRGTAP